MFSARAPINAPSASGPSESTRAGPSRVVSSALRKAGMIDSDIQMSGTGPGKKDKVIRGSLARRPGRAHIESFKDHAAGPARVNLVSTLSRLLSALAICLRSSIHYPIFSTLQLALFSNIVLLLTCIQLSGRIGPAAAAAAARGAAGSAKQAANRTRRLTPLDRVPIIGDGDVAPGKSRVVEQWREFVKSRWSPEARILDLQVSNHPVWPPLETSPRRSHNVHPFVLLEYGRRSDSEETQTCSPRTTRSRRNFQARFST